MAERENQEITSYLTEKDKQMYALMREGAREFFIVATASLVFFKQDPAVAGLIMQLGQEALQKRIIR